MGRLKTIKPRLQSVANRLPGAPASSTRRLTGRALQARRYRMWLDNPNCARCGRLMAYPHGFELDHVTPLYQGGEDTEANCQLLCAGPDGCHAAKTAEDMGRGICKV